MPLAAFDAAVETIFEQIVEAVEGCGDDLGSKVVSGLRALVRALAREPGVARLVLIEIRAVGKAGQEHHECALQRFAQLLAEARLGGPPESPDGLSRLIAGSVENTIATAAREGGAGELDRLLPELAFTVLAPYLGAEAAGEAIRRCGLKRRHRLEDWPQPSCG